MLCGDSCNDQSRGVIRKYITQESCNSFCLPVGCCILDDCSLCDSIGIQAEQKSHVVMQ
ncbi:hypothetical protein HanPI659440_Chr05g0186291 [Helianthus annuus]|nr:hypothetical protein HanPI659440_Chr05g0186291 [Helianthus annuus]